MTVTLMTFVLTLSLNPCQVYHQMETLSFTGHATAAWESAYGDLLEAYPGCDRLHFFPSQSLPRDEKFYATYFQRAGRDPVVLGAILQRYDELSPFLPSEYQDPIKLLERFIWSNHLPESKDCPCGEGRGEVVLRGFLDEYFTGCYRIHIFYTVPPSSYEYAISLSWDEPFLFKVVVPRLQDLLKKSGAPRLHRIFYGEKPRQERRGPSNLPYTRRKSP